jgi:hypothetical protein
MSIIKLKRNLSNKRTKKAKQFRKTTKQRGGMDPSSRGKSKSKTPSASVRTSSRFAGKPLMTQVKFNKGNNPASPAELQAVVNKIKEGPQIVADIVITHKKTPNEQHAFLVDVRSSEGKIMISDWGGETNKTRGRSNPDWSQYSTFMTSLEEKFGLPIEYYPVDQVLYDKALDHHGRCRNSGGCSNYIYAWVNKHYSDYSI